jgi:LacI family transcriptional regulator
VVTLPKRATILSIAQYLGLSKSTVSAALAGDPAVRDTTRERVIQASAEMGYRRNLHARTLRTRKSMMIGLIVPDMLAQFFGPSYTAIDYMATRAGYTVFQTTSQNNPERERTLLEYYLNWSAEGVMIGLGYGTAEVYNPIARRMPLLFIDTMPPGVRADLVSIDQYQGGWLAGQNFAQCGRRSLLYLAPQINPIQPFPGYSDTWINERLRGFTDALRAAGMADPVVVRGAAVNRIDVPHTRDILTSLLSSGMQFDGIFAANDFLAFSAIDALKELGVRVPEDVAIIGFDYNLERAKATGELTTIEYPFKEIGERGMALLLSRIADANKGDSVSVKVVPRLITGASTG